SRKDDTRHQSARDKWHAWRRLAPATGERMHPITLLGLTDGPATRAPILQATTLHASREFSTSPCRPNRGSVAFILCRGIASSTGYTRRTSARILSSPRTGI